jgi:hypothetical protein
MTEEKSPEDIVASALAHAMHGMGADMESQATTQDQTTTS